MDRSNTLRQMQICRFCLDDDGPFTNIYERDSRDGMQSTPLPLQIMACVAIEVFSNDGMPQLICSVCRAQTIGAYYFKTTCKKSDDALKLFLATGKLVKPTSTKRRYASKKSPTAKRVGASPEIKKSLTKTTKTEYQDSENEDESMNDENYPEDMEVNEQQDEEEEVESQEGTENSEEEQLEEGETMNPTLKVPQVQTDVFPCPECERSFPLKQLLDLHSKNHNRERSFECDQCRRKFFTKYDLAKHYQTHSLSKPFVCIVCNKSFSRESLLHRHEKIHIDVPKYLCTQCDRTFLTREDLDAHSEKHKKNRPYTCRICKKAFVFKQGLERHELSHTEEKPHKCNYCEASFTTPIKLMRHITSHAGLRPYPCKLCGRTFLLSHHLTRHMRSHYANKSAAVDPVGQHKCDVCSMSFRRKDSLINHSAIHSMVNLKCVICNTAFNNAKQVKEHITTHLAGLPYPCDKCDYSFDTTDQLEEHELKHAEMEYEDQIEQEVTQEAKALEEAEEEEDTEEEDITEFTITNDLDDNPQVIRRPKKAKIKNYAQFLKDELGSDIEHEEIIDEDNKEFVKNEIEGRRESIKPIVRNESTKVYTRKSLGNEKRPKTTEVTNINSIKNVTTEENQSSINLDNRDLTKLKHDVKNLPNKKFVDMKIGDKTVRVQKVMMTKAEIEAMAREGKIEVKGDTIILNKNQTRQPQKNITIENILDQDIKPTISKSYVMKTYVRKSVPAATPPTSIGAETIIQEEVVRNEEGIDLQHS